MRFGRALFLAVLLHPAAGTQAQSPPDAAVPCPEGQAVLLEHGTHTEGCEISTETDIDTFLFDAEAGETYRITFDSAVDQANDLDIMIEVQDPENVDVGGTTCANPCAQAIGVNATKDGTYRVRVSDSGFDGTGQYRLALDRALPPGWLPGVEYGRWQTAGFLDHLDYDVFSIPVRSGSEVRLFVIFENHGEYAASGSVFVNNAELSISYGFSGCFAGPGSDCRIPLDFTPGQTGLASVTFLMGESGPRRVLLEAACLFGPCPEGYFIGDLRFETRTHAEWSPTSDPGATFQVVRGDLGELRATHGSFARATTDCISTGNILPFIEDGDELAPGAGFFYVARACAPDIGCVSYDTASPSQLSRDGGRDIGLFGVASSPSACPNP